jgi:hypothetical protein
MRFGGKAVLVCLAFGFGVSVALTDDGSSPVIPQIKANHICSGSVHCKAQECLDQYLGWSCSEFIAINHQKCNPGRGSCAVYQRDCVRIWHYGGTVCDGNGKCTGGVQHPVPTTIQEEGC